MTTAAQRVEAYVNRAAAWRDEIAKLRAIVLSCGLDEDLKWGKPCFMRDERNIAIIQPFKAHCALMFFKGVLLDDPHDLLRRQGANSQSARRMEFTSAREIRKGVVASYVKQAIAVEASGATVAFTAKDELDLPDELAAALKRDRALAKAFHALTPGRQRSHVLHIAGAKQSTTRTARIEKCTPKILAGKGMNER